MDFYMIKIFMFILCIIADAVSGPKTSSKSGKNKSEKFRIGSCVKNLRVAFNERRNPTELHYKDLPKTAFLTKTKFSYFKHNEPSAFFNFTLKRINPDLTLSPHQFCSVTVFVYGDCINELHEVFIFEDNYSALEITKWLYLNKKQSEITYFIKKRKNFKGYALQYYNHIIAQFDVYNADERFVLANFCEYLIKYGDPDGPNTENDIPNYAGESSVGNLPTKENVPLRQTLEPYDNNSLYSINMIDGGQSSGGNLLPIKSISAMPSFNTSSYLQTDMTNYGGQGRGEPVQSSNLFKSSKFSAFKTYKSPSSKNINNEEQSSGGNVLSGRSVSATPTFDTSGYPPPNITYYGRQDSGHYSQPSDTTIPSTSPLSIPYDYSQTCMTLMRGRGSGEYLQSSNLVLPSKESAFKSYAYLKTNGKNNYREESSQGYVPPTSVIPPASTLIPYYEHSKSVINDDDYNLQRYVYPNQSISATSTSGNSQSSTTGQGRGEKLPSSSNISYPGRYTRFDPPR